MKRQRAFLAQSQGVKKPKLVNTLAVTTSIPRPLGLSRAQKKEVNRLITKKEEIKYVDWNFASSSISSTGSTTDLCAIAQGANQSQRIGNQLRLLSFKIIGNVIAADTTNTIRFVFWTYKQNSGNSTPDLNFVMNYGSSAVSVQPDSQYMYPQKKTYKILHDRMFSLSTAANPIEQYIIRVPVPPSVADIDFNPGSNTGVNHMFLSVVSDSVAATHPSFTGTIRLFYADA